MQYLTTFLILSQSLAKESSTHSLLRKAKNDYNSLENNDMEMKNINRRLGVVKATPVGVYDGDSVTAFSTCFRDNDILAQKENIQRYENGPYSIMDLTEGITIAEKFEGLKQDTATGIIGLEDYLHGTPVNPLALSTNHNHREDLWVERDYETEIIYKDGKKKKKKNFFLKVMGRGMGGYAGLGAVAIMFDKDKRTINLKFWSDGTSTANVRFYDKKGRELGRLNVDLKITNEYRFSHDNGKIRGMALWSDGEALDWHKMGLVGLCHE